MIHIAYTEEPPTRDSSAGTEELLTTEAQSDGNNNHVQDKDTQAETVVCNTAEISAHPEHSGTHFSMIV